MASVSHVASQHMQGRPPLCRHRAGALLTCHLSPSWRGATAAAHCPSQRCMTSCRLEPEALHRRAGACTGFPAALRLGTAACGAQTLQQLLPRPGRARQRGARCERRSSRGGGGPQDRMQNAELLVGDCLCLLCFALYKQITALIFLPSFPGWLAPLAFNPARFLEFFSFAATLMGTWVGSGYLAGGYRFTATADMESSLSRTCLMWLISMPVAAAQLVLLTAAEDAVLVGEEGFASRLPLAATGPGEPFTTAAGVLGLMCVWRAFYAAYLDIHSFRGAAAARRDRERDMRTFADSLRVAMLLSLACCAVLQALGGLVGEEQLEVLASYLAAAVGAS